MPTLTSESLRLASRLFHLAPSLAFCILARFARSYALSIDKSKLVYILNRNAEGNLFPSSPLEAHKPHAIISAMIGVDVGYDNPLYACLETGYEEADGDWTGEAAQAAQKVSRGVGRGEGGCEQAFSGVVEGRASVERRKRKSRRSRRMEGKWSGREVICVAGTT